MMRIVSLRDCTMKEKPLRIVQISDIHLFGNKEKTLLGVKTEESFQAVVKLLLADAMSPDLILLTGDLAQDGSEAAYLRIADALRMVQVPIYYVPGNHDDSQVMKQVYLRENISVLKHIVLDRWHFILLDSQKPGAVEGYLSRTELNFLQNALQMYPDRHAVIVFHHPPVLVGSAWLDRIGLTNSHELQKILALHSGVNMVLFGHVHQRYENEMNGVKYYSTPSTCFQFKKDSDDFALDRVTPAYRWIELYSNGESKTGVNRLAEYVGVFEKNAKGY